GNAVLIGDISNPTSGTSVKFKAKVKVHGGQSAPTATGLAQIQSVSRKGKTSQRFTLIASGVPANSTFAVSVNGAQASSVQSNKKGRLLVKKLGANHLGIRSVRLVDGQGRTAASARF